MRKQEAVAKRSSGVRFVQDEESHVDEVPRIGAYSRRMFSSSRCPAIYWYHRPPKLRRSTFNTYIRLLCSGWRNAYLYTLKEHAGTQA